MKILKENRVVGLLSVIILAVMGTVGCGTPDISAGSGIDGTIRVNVEPGMHYRHKLKVMPLVTVRNPPQMAVWAETSDGEFIKTLYVTRRTADESWRSAPGDEVPEGGIRRPESLPVWTKRSGRLDSGIDTMGSVTPKSGYSVRSDSLSNRDDLWIWLEVNHSTDFNDAYPEDARPGDADFSGGPWGSGQPSLVYVATVFNESQRSVVMKLLGHGSPDGSDGLVHQDLSGVTSATEIIGEAIVTIE